MKQLNPIICLLLMCSSCAYYSYSVPQSNEKRLSEIPTPAHHHEVEVLFPGELVKDTNYIKIEVIEVRGSVHESYNDLIAKMQSAAQEKGVDAVYIFERNTFSTLKHDRANETVNSIFSGTYTPMYKTENTSILTALGIKYIKNIDYLDQYISSIEILAYDTILQNFKLNSVLFVDFEEQITSIGGDVQFYNKWVYPYSNRHLVEEKTVFWRYSQPTDFKIFRDQYDFEGALQKSCTIIMNEDFQPLSIDVKYNGKYHDQITHNYQNKKLSSRNLKLANGMELVEEYSYHNEKLMEVKTYRLINGKKEPFLLLNYVYHTNDEAVLYK